MAGRLPVTRTGNRLQCARCLRRQYDVDRVHLFLCDDCTRVYGDEAFRATAPLFRAALVKGRCESCDKLGEISYAQWLTCGYCARIVHSYRMGRISAAFALEQIRNVVQPIVPHLNFEEADPIIIQATARRGRRRELATKLDFKAVQKADGIPVFWLELKTGPGSIERPGQPDEDAMAEFQLDCSDCDDITNTVISSGLPAILLHCQVVRHPEPPTMRIVGKALWWTDLESFTSKFKDVRARRGNERKQAAYFDTSCFQPIGALSDFLMGGWIERAKEALSKNGCPALYHA
jgi:hypothetical protein